jgi:hypothetical protein
VQSSVGVRNSGTRNEVIGQLGARVNLHLPDAARHPHYLVLEGRIRMVTYK